MLCNVRYSGAFQLPDVLNSINFTTTECSTIATILAKPDRATEISPFSSGALIFEALQIEGTVTARMLLEWWLAEDAFARLAAFMDNQFPDRAALLERSGTYNFRYRIQRADLGDDSPDNTSTAGDHALNMSGDEADEFFRWRMIDDDEVEGDVNLANPFSEIFSKIESHKRQLLIQDYSVSQSTLEQIFNQFASQSDNSSKTNC